MVFKSYDIENDSQFRAAIEKTVKNVSDLRLEFGLISKNWRKSNRANFILKGAGKYSPLNPEYQRRKTILAGRKLPILVGANKGKTKKGKRVSGGGESGRLRDSVIDNGSKDSILVIGKTSMIMGTSVPYGRYVQEKRKFLFITETNVNVWMKILSEATKRKIGI